MLPWSVRQALQQTSWLSCLHPELWLFQGIYLFLVEAFELHSFPLRSTNQCSQTWGSQTVAKRALSEQQIGPHVCTHARARAHSHICSTHSLHRLLPTSPLASLLLGLPSPALVCPLESCGVFLLKHQFNPVISLLTIVTDNGLNMFQQPTAVIISLFSQITK